MPARPPAARHPRRRAAFRVAAVALGLLPLVLIEGALRVAGIGELDDARDPYVGFAEIRTLFERSDDGQRFTTSMARQTFFRQVSFAAKKPQQGRRIFVLGGSTVQGRPWAVETAFSTWLELTLEAADPSRPWEVVNCGGISYASYRLVPILQEILSYEPDLVVLYTGHNEFLEDRTYQQVKSAPDWFLSTHALFTNSRAYNATRAVYQNATGQAPAPPPTLPTEVRARLDRAGGLGDYQRDDAWQHDVVRHFESNLRRMLALANAAEVPLMLINPVSNLSDSQPIKSQSGDLSSADHAEIERLVLRARAAAPPHRISALRRAVAIDPRDAASRFALGRAYLETGRTEEARKAFVRAKDEDVCPLRATEAIHEAIERVASDSVPMLDARRVFESASPGGIVGAKWFVDHVHPTIAGHQRLASHLFRAVAETLAVQSKSGWEERRDRAFRDHLASLPPSYDKRAKVRLEGLKLWAAGHARIPPSRPQ